MLSLDMQVGVVNPDRPGTDAKLALIGNHGGNEFTGLEATGIGYNHARTLNGAQIEGAGLNIADEMNGTQISVVGGSYARVAKGVQGDGVISIARRLYGFQFGGICYAGDGDFFQVGVVTIRGSGPWYSRISPLVGFRRGH